MYKVRKWVLSGPESSFIIHQVFIEHLNIPDTVLGIKMLLKDKRKLRDFEFCCQLLNEQQFSPWFSHLHYYFCNSSFDLSQCIFLIWLLHFIWDGSAVINILKCTKRHWCDAMRMTWYTHDSSLKAAPAQQLVIIKNTVSTCGSLKESNRADSLFLLPKQITEQGAFNSSPLTVLPPLFPVPEVQKHWKLLHLLESSAWEPLPNISNLTVAILTYRPALPTQVIELGFLGLQRLSRLYTTEKEG